MIRLIKNSADKAKIELIGDIGDNFWGEGWTLERFKNELETMDVGEIDVDIQSMGGEVLEAFAIYDAIRELPQKVTTRMIGSTASAGTVIAMAGDQREISPNSRFLIHNASTITMGDDEEHKKQEETLRSIDAQLVAIYRKATGRKPGDLVAQMRKGNWMTSQEALSWGFVDKLTDVKILNKSDMDTKILEVLNVKDEDEAMVKVQGLMDVNDDLAKQVTDLQDKVANYEQAEADKRTAEINDYLSTAVADKRITAESVDKWSALAQNDFETVKTTIDNIQVRASLEEVIDEAPPEQPKTFMDKWKAGDYANDAEALARDYEKEFGKPLK